MPLSFYISSPFRGLQQERAAVKKAITQNNHAYKDSYEASSDPVIASCLVDVEGCDIYVLLLAYRYGTRTDGGQGPSITELEFDQAVQSGKPIYSYDLNFTSGEEASVDLADVEGNARLLTFKRKVGQHCRSAQCPSLQDLAERIHRLAANPPARDNPTPTDPNEAFLDVAKGLRRVAHELLKNGSGNNCSSNNRSLAWNTKQGWKKLSPYPEKVKSPLPTGIHWVNYATN